MNLKLEIEQLLWLPATVNELAAILEADRKIVSSTLHNLKKQGKARRIGTKWEDSTCRGRPCQRRMSIWGHAGCTFKGYLHMNSLSRSSGVVTAAVRDVEPNSFPTTGATRGGRG